MLLFTGILLFLSMPVFTGMWGMAVMQEGGEEKRNVSAYKIYEKHLFFMEM